MRSPFSLVGVVASSITPLLLIASPKPQVTHPPNSVNYFRTYAQVTENQTTENAENTERGIRVREVFCVSPISF